MSGRELYEIFFTYLNNCTDLEPFEWFYLLEEHRQAWDFLARTYEIKKKEQKEGEKKSA